MIAFPEIETAPKGIFRLGIAYPISAWIVGEGVGAVRYCTFSTGDFVEPDGPYQLAFHTTENPLPMKEISIHNDLHVPHLDGHLVAQKGQFRLIEKDDKVHLEGTTWYDPRISPGLYWGTISNYIKVHAEAHD